MALTYDSEFWRIRVAEAQDLANQMKGAAAQAAMKRMAEGYERNRLRCAHDEAELALNDARKKLDDNIGSAPPEKLARLWASIDDRWATLQRARQELEAHIQACPDLQKVAAPLIISERHR